MRLKDKIRKIYRDHLGHAEPNFVPLGLWSEAELPSNGFGLSFGLEALVAQVWMLIQKGKGK